MNHNCSVCGKSVTPAAYAYCIKREYPIMCHKHQQEYGLNRYHVVSKEEIEVIREAKAEEEAQKANRSPEEKREIAIKFIKELSYKLRTGEVHKTYKEAFKREIELGKEYFTEDEINKLNSCYNKFANLTEADGKRIKKENESKVEAALKQLGKEYTKHGKGFKVEITVVNSEIDKITSQYPVDKKLNEWLLSVISNQINNELIEGLAQYVIDDYGNESLEIF